MDASSSDLARLLRAFAIRAFALTLLAGVLGHTTMTIVLALVGMGLLFAPVDAMGRRQDVDS
jgi:hypothetical protein